MMDDVMKEVRELLKHLIETCWEDMGDCVPCRYCGEDDIDGGGHNQHCKIYTMRGILKRLPRWTPVAEGLPEFRDTVLAQFESGLRGLCWINFKGDWCYSFDGSIVLSSITHWQPLPAPYNPEVVT